MCAGLDEVHASMTEYLTDMHAASSVESERELRETHANELRSMLDGMYLQRGTVSRAEA